MHMETWSAFLIFANGRMVHSTVQRLPIHNLTGSVGADTTSGSQTMFFESHSSHCSLVKLLDMLFSTTPYRN